MAAVNSFASQLSLPLSRPKYNKKPPLPCSRALLSPSSSPLSTTTTTNNNSRSSSSRPNLHRGSRRDLAVAWVTAQDMDVLPVKSSDSTDQQDGADTLGRERDDSMDGGGIATGGYAFESRGVGDVGGAGYSSPPSPPSTEGEEFGKAVDRTINATIVLAAGTFAITKLLTIDRDYWHERGIPEEFSSTILGENRDAFREEMPRAEESDDGIPSDAIASAPEEISTAIRGWTIFEILRYAPLHNWTAYEEALKTNPVLAKMMISGVVYSVGDWIAQCYEGKPLFDFDRTRMFRSGLVGFTLHGSLSHYYYQFCEALFPFQDWWVVPAKVAFDQTAWAALWNSIYYVVLGFLRFESPANVFKELKATFWPMLTAGWKLWPFAHLITYGVIPLEQRLLWVDCVELVWVTILSTYSNEKSEARNSEALADPNTKSASAASEE